MEDESEKRQEAPIESMPAEPAEVYAEDRCPLGYKPHCDQVDECRKNDKLRFMCINMHKPKFKDDEWH